MTMSERRIPLHMSPHDAIAAPADNAVEYPFRQTTSVYLPNGDSISYQNGYDDGWEARDKRARTARADLIKIIESMSVAFDFDGLAWISKSELLAAMRKASG